MTSVFVDATEADTDTRLPQAVIATGRVLVGLEKWTGADILLTPLSAPPLPETLTEARPHMLALKRHCEAGELIQRKTGRDLTSSIPALPGIEWRMQQWTSYPRLLFVGDLGYDARGTALIDGQDTGFSYQAVIGALDAWQARGGCVTMLSRDGALPRWVSLRLDHLKAPSEAKLFYRQPRQKLLGSDPALDILTVFPGVGLTRGKALLEKHSSLVRVLMALSDPKAVERGHVEGMGEITYRRARAPFTVGKNALTETQRLEIVECNHLEDEPL